MKITKQFLREREYMDKERETFSQGIKKEVVNDKRFIIRLVLIAAVVAGLYLFLSPYQSCLRKSGEAELRYCGANTNW